MELRRREHARSVGVLADRLGRVSVRHERCEFTGGRDDLAGGSRLFGGPAVAEGIAGELTAPEPPWPIDREELAARLLSFSAWVGGEVVLRHLTVATGRAVRAGDGPAVRRVSVVFALTGQVVTGNGRTLPIAVSGRGNGLTALSDHRLAEDIARMRGALAAATGPVRGRPPAVLRPQAAAVLAHEAVGHYAEAMHVGAPAVHRLYTRIAGECLSVVDEADQGGPPHQHDDEGVLSLGPTEVVRHGVLVGQLHTRATARAAAAAPTGNGRAAQVWDLPIPRMSTLVCAPGRRPEAELVGEIRSGVCIHRLADGYRQGTTVSARIVLGEHIERGRRTGRYFTGGQVNGRLDLFTRLVELGDKAERSPNAMCGKDGQLLFDVSTVAPAMRLSALSLGSGP